MTRFFLIRDNIPKLLANKTKNGCFYSIAATDEFYRVLLRELYINLSNSCVSSLQLDAVSQDRNALKDDLVEIITVIKTLAKSYNISDQELDALYYDRLKEQGGYNERYIGFFEEEDLQGILYPGKIYQPRESTYDPLVEMPATTPGAKEVPTPEQPANLTDSNATVDLSAVVPNSAPKTPKAANSQRSKK